MGTVVEATETDEMTLDQGRAMLATRVGDRLGITLDEFLRRLDQGEYAGTEDRDVLTLVTLAPFAR